MQLGNELFINHRLGLPQPRPQGPPRCPELLTRRALGTRFGLPHKSFRPLFSGFSDVCLANMPDMCFITLIEEIKFMLISSRDRHSHLCRVYTRHVYLRYMHFHNRFTSGKSRVNNGISQFKQSEAGVPTMRYLPPFLGNYCAPNKITCGICLF